MKSQLYNLTLLYVLIACKSAPKADITKEIKTTAFDQVDIDSLIKSELRTNVENNKKQIGYIYPNYSHIQNQAKKNNIQIKGKVVFINFWFASCTPCQEEFNALNVLYEKFGSDKRFTMLSFTFETEPKIEKMRHKKNLQFPILQLTKEDCEELNLKNGHPTNFLLNKKGEIINIYTGGHGSALKTEIFFKENIYPSIKALL